MNISNWKKTGIPNGFRSTYQKEYEKSYNTTKNLIGNQLSMYNKQLLLSNKVNEKEDTDEKRYQIIMQS